MTSYSLLKDKLGDVLTSLTERERKVLELRFGLTDGYSRTLEEVGKQFKVTRERIRQIEARPPQNASPRACANCRASLTAKASTASVLANWPRPSHNQKQKPRRSAGFFVMANSTNGGITLRQMPPYRAAAYQVAVAHTLSMRPTAGRICNPQPRCRKGRVHDRNRAPSVAAHHVRGVRRILEPSPSTAPLSTDSISARMAIIASQNRSNSSFDSLSSAPPSLCLPRAGDRWRMESKIH